MLRVLFLPSANVLGVEIHGQVLGADVDHVLIEIDRRIKEHSKCRLLVDVVPDSRVGRRISPALLTTLKLAYVHRKHLERCALVGDSWRVRGFVWVVNVCFRRIDTRCFPRVSRDLAVHWLTINDRALVPVADTRSANAYTSPGQGASARIIPASFKSTQKVDGIF